MLLSSAQLFKLYRIGLRWGKENIFQRLYFHHTGQRLNLGLMLMLNSLLGLSNIAPGGVEKG